MSVFKRRSDEPQQRAAAVEAPLAPVQNGSAKDIQIFGRELFQGFQAKEASSAAGRQAKSQAPAWQRDLEGAVDALRGGSQFDGPIQLSREGLSPRERVAGQQVAVLHDISAAIEVANPQRLTQEEALRAKGALGMTQLALATPIAERGRWFAGAQEEARRLERMLETLPARMQHRRNLGLDEKFIAQEQVRELDAAQEALRVMGLRSLPRELHTKAPSIALAAPDLRDTVADQIQAMRAYVQGVRFSLEEGGAGRTHTALDVMRGTAKDASTLRQDPTVAPYLVADRKVLAAFESVRDAIVADPKAGAAVTGARKPELEVELASKVSPDLARAMAGSAAASAGQIYESSQIRDMALFLNGDPAYVSPEAQRHALKAIVPSDELTRYREAAEMLMDSPTVKDLPKAMDTFQRAALDLTAAWPGAMVAVSALGWGPLGVMAAAAKTRPTALEIREAKELALAIDHGAGEGYAMPFTPGSKTYMDPAPSPGADPMVIQISNNGKHARAWEFQNGKPTMAFEGPVAGVPVSEKARQVFQEAGDVLTRPHARIKLAQAGLIDMQAPPTPIYTRTPFLVDPSFQAPPQRDLMPYGEAAPVEALDRNSLREAAARA